MSAWRHRHKQNLESPKPKPVADGNLSFSLPNIATIATGSLVAKAAATVLSNEPTQREVVELIKSLSRNVGYSMGQVNERLNQLDDFNKALEDEFFGLKNRVQATKQRRLGKS